MSCTPPNSPCHLCGKPGHWQRKCPLAGAATRCGGAHRGNSNCRGKGGGRGKGNRANIAVAADDHNYAFMATNAPAAVPNTAAAIPKAAHAADSDSLTWYADSAATSHITNNCASLDDYIETPGSIRGARRLASLGRGNVKLVFDINGQGINITLKDVMYVPEMLENLISL